MTDEGIDDFIRQVQADELKDALEVTKYISVGDFARARGITPQLVHYYIRQGKLRRVSCCCGQPRLVTAEANELFDVVQKNHTGKIEQAEEENEGYAVSWIRDRE